MGVVLDLDVHDSYCAYASGGVGHVGVYAGALTEHVGGVLDGPDDKHEAFFQKTRVDIVRALSPGGLFDHHRHQIKCLRFHNVLQYSRLGL